MDVIGSAYQMGPPDPLCVLSEDQRSDNRGRGKGVGKRDGWELKRKRKKRINLGEGEKTLLPCRLTANCYYE